MRLKKTLGLLALLILAAFLLVYIRFYRGSQPDYTVTEEREKLYVLAPYEIRYVQEILETIAREYSRDPSKPEVVFEFVEKDELKKELSMRHLEKKSDVGLLLCDRALMPELIHMGILSEIPVDQTLRERVSRPELWQDVEEGLACYGVPFTCDPYVLYYRSDHFEEAGVHTFSSWQDLYEKALGMRRTGYHCLGFAAKRDSEVAELYELILRSKGGDLRQINQTCGLEVLDLFQQMTRSRVISRELRNYSQEDLAREFAQGKISMMIGKMSLSALLRTSQINFHVGMMQLPQDNAGGTFYYGDALCLTTNGGQAGMDFINYMLKPEVYGRICDVMDTLPVFADVPYVKESRICMDQAEKLADQVAIPDQVRLRSSMNQILADGVYRAMVVNPPDIQAIADQVQDQIRVALYKE